MVHQTLKHFQFIAAFLFLFFVTASAQIPSGYKGKPYIDSIYARGVQCIPGRVELAFYDLGGEGIAYHDVTPANEGAALNHTEGHHRPGIPASLAFFRENEGVDISYTKDWADFNHPNKVDPAVNQLYIGWEEDGEWTNYTVDVKAPGKYKIITVYGYQDNKSSLWLNNAKAVDLKMTENTGNWHYWTQATVGEITFTKTGLNLLTLRYNKGANLAYFDFVLIQ
ncbi:MAG: hypothetical protein KA247_08570 [Bacteroidetes bacterium]|nr:hypothetical protein [Bacteroidota bacterium]